MHEHVEEQERAPALPASPLLPAARLSGISNAALARVLARNPVPATMPPPNQTVDPKMSVDPGKAPTNEEFEKRVSVPAGGVHANKHVATWGRWVETKLVTGTRDPKNFTTLAAASAWARGLGKPAAVFAEKLYVSAEEKDTAVDGFVVYVVNHDSWSSFTRSGTKLGASGPDTSIKAVPGVPVLQLVTQDGTAIAPATGDKTGEANYATWMVQEKGPAGNDPFGGQVAAFGPGLESIKTGDAEKDKAKFLAIFANALEDTAQSIIGQAAVQAAKKRDELGEGIPDDDYAKIEAALPELLRISERIDAIEGPLGEVGRASSKERVDELNKELDRLYVEKNQQLNRYPLLSQFAAPGLEGTERLRGFNKMDREQRRAALVGSSKDVLANIDKTRANIFGGGLDIWTLGPLVEATLAGLQIKDTAFRDAALKKAKFHTGINTAFDIALGVLQIGLGIAAAIATGPLAIALSAGALTVGVVSASAMTADYFVNKAAANTNIDKREALKPGDLDDEWMAVAVAWIAVGLDASAVVKACAQAEKAGITLKQASERFAEQLKRTPGDLMRWAQRTFAPLSEAEARAALFGGVKRELHESLAGVKVTVLPEEDFAARFQSKSGEAVTIIGKDSKGAVTREVVVKDTATFRSIADEGVHLEQSVDPELAEKMAKLSAAEAGWSKLALENKLTAYGQRLDIEIDAAERTMKSLAKDDPVLHDYEGMLADLKKYREDIRAALAEKDPDAMAKRVPWFDPQQPPHLFAKARLPKSDGIWSDPRKPGNCLWLSDNKDVLKITKGKGVPFRNNYPVFTEWSEATVKGTAGCTMAEADECWARQIMARNRQADYPEFFKIGDRQLPKGEFNGAAIKRWRTEYRYTWHHHQGEGNLMLLLPRDLHGNVPHTGGSAVARGSHTR